MTDGLSHHLGALPAPARRVLGAVAYGGPWQAGDAPVLPVDMPVLSGQAPALSVLSTDAPVHYGAMEGVRFARTDTLVFGVLSVDETSVAGGLEAATERAYTALFATLDRLAYPTLLRVWNYLPGINAELDGVERYRRFNAGRQQAFAASERPLSGRVPAACALGTVGGPLAIAFLGSVTPFVPVENPRQVSAYHYPPEYGERSPTFSRAGLTRLDGHDALFISGTAAIVGHASLHVGDIVAQTQETLTNLEAVLEAANAYPGAIRHRLEALDFTVYVRRAEDASVVLGLVRERVGPDARVVCVQADVCRAELLVEIEAVGGLHGGEGT